MPNWADDEGRFWYTPPSAMWWDTVQIPHAPVTVRKGCRCQFCRDKRQAKRK